MNGYGNTLPVAPKKRSKKSAAKKNTKKPRRLTRARIFTSDSCLDAVARVCEFINGANRRYVGFTFIDQVAVSSEAPPKRGVGRDSHVLSPRGTQHYTIIVIFSYRKRVSTKKKRSKLVKPM